jgi:hypothetical protein
MAHKPHLERCWIYGYDKNHTLFILYIYIYGIYI